MILPEKEENRRLKEHEAENLLELELQKYKTYGLYFLISIMLIGSSYIYYYLKAKNREKKIQASSQPNFKLQKNYMMN
jgi:hypothetical protein